MRIRPLLVAVPVLTIAFSAGVVLIGQERLTPQLPAPVTPRDARDAGEARPGTGLLSGTLVAADSGRPVRRASVTLAGAEIGVRRTAMTDEMGRFSFDQLPAGAFTLSANRQGYLDVAFGQRTPGSGRPGTPIQLAAGQRLENVSMRMPRTGILTGAITDEFGDPAMGIQVQAWRWVKRSGERLLQSAGMGTTDDRGIYRIAGLLPGEYIVGTGARDTSETMLVESMKLREFAEVRATLSGMVIVDGKPTVDPYTVSAISGAPKVGYASVYYPGTLQSSSATSVTLGISEERSSVDLQLQAVPLVRVSGSVVGPDGALPPGGEVRLIESGSVLPAARAYSSPIRGDGTFLINGVPPGQYMLVARTNPRVMMRVVQPDGATSIEGKGYEWEVEMSPARRFSAYGVQTQPSGAAPEALWGQTDIGVDGRPISNVVLSLQRGFDVSGTFAFDGAPPQPPDLSRIRVQLAPASTTGIDAGLPTPASIYNGGRFTLRGVTPGRYRLNASGLPAGWVLKSANFGGRDVLDTMLEVRPGDELAGGILTFTNQSTELSGTLQDQSGKPVADYTIVVFSSDRRFWTPLSRRIQAMRPSTDGRFSFRNLPAGDYRLIAVVDPEPGEWFDPAFLDQLVGATMPLTIGDGERKVQDVRIAK
ncbi:MAG TPA: carboxypeptidase-like regulatory domain-containing protein [Vicinamibacterales bacterium]|nr:carboxypeptidase-like regulatory domain-containing protein [Vicinamibacterales bacterium]